MDDALTQAIRTDLVVGDQPCPDCAHAGWQHLLNGCAVVPPSDEPDEDVRCPCQRSGTGPARP
jgi:hypothetical protein